MYPTSSKIMFPNISMVVTMSFLFESKAKEFLGLTAALCTRDMELLLVNSIYSDLKTHTYV